MEGIVFFIIRIIIAILIAQLGKKRKIGNLIRFRKENFYLDAIN